VCLSVSVCVSVCHRRGWPPHNCHTVSVLQRVPPAIFVGGFRYNFIWGYT